MEMMTHEEAATYTKLKPSTLYRLTAAKKIPHFKINALLRYDRADLDTWLVSQKVEVADDAN